MAIETSELLVFKSAVVNDTTANGGRIDKGAQSVSGVANNTFPSVTSAERTAGLTRYRKIFVSNQDTENLDLTDMQVAVALPLAGEGRFYIFAGTQTDTQNDISSPDKFGAGTLDSSVSASATEIDVAVEDGTEIIFRDTETIYIYDGSNAEFATISGTPTVDADVVTITLSAGLANAYTAGSGTKIASVYEPTDPEAVIENVTDSNGLFDETQVTVPNKGSVYENWTLEYTSSTEFTLTGDTLGLVGSGDVSTLFEPNNPDTSSPYISIPVATHEGSPATSNQVTFRTVPAAVPIWQEVTYDAAAAATGAPSANLKIFYVSP